MRICCPGYVRLPSICCATMMASSHHCASGGSAGLRSMAASVEPGLIPWSALSSGEYGQLFALGNLKTPASHRRVNCVGALLSMQFDDKIVHLVDPFQRTL